MAASFSELVNYFYFIPESIVCQNICLHGEFYCISGIIFLCIIMNIFIISSQTADEKVYENFESSLKPKKTVISNGQYSLNNLDV